MAVTKTGATIDLSQTLSRGLTVLEMVAAHHEPLSTVEIMRRMNLPRTNIYRLIYTLRAHSLVEGTSKGWQLGPGVGALLTPGVALEAPPEVLTRVATATGATAVLVHKHNDMCRIRALATPKSARATITPTMLHSLRLGATGIATLASMVGSVEEKEMRRLAGPRLRDVYTAIERGWTNTHDEIMRGISALAVPLARPPATPGAVAVLTRVPCDIEAALGVLTDAATELSSPAS